MRDGEGNTRELRVIQRNLRKRKKRQMIDERKQVRDGKGDMRGRYRTEGKSRWKTSKTRGGRRMELESRGKKPGRGNQNEKQETDEAERRSAARKGRPSGGKSYTAGLGN